MTTSVTDSAPAAGTAETVHKTRKDPGTHTKSTLFLRGLPATCTSGDLESFFSEWGPVRSAFPVTKREGESPETEAGASVIGFVHFALAEDAQRALAALQGGSLPFMGCAITGELALRKRREGGRTDEGQNGEGRRGGKGHVDGDGAHPADGGQKKERKRGTGTTVAGGARAEPKSKKARLTGSGGSSALLISIRAPASLATTTPQFDKKQLYKRLRKCGDLVEVTFPLEDSVARARLLFSSATAAQAAIPKIDQHIFKGYRLLVEPSETSRTGQTGETATSAIKAHRLIIRNLPWTASEEALRQELAPLGTLVEVTVPKGARGTSRGFAFVQFAERAQAEAAMARFNGRLLLERPVALDFALSKSHYLRAEQGDEGISDTEVVDVENTSDAEAPTLLREQDQHGASDEAGDVDVENVTDDEEQEKDRVPRDTDEDESEATTPLQTTVFIRNVPFTTEEEELARLLTERFGPVVYCKLVRDPQTGAARGTAFAKFVAAQAAREAIVESAKLTQDQLDDTQQEGASPVRGEEEERGKEAHRLDDKLAALARRRTGKTTFKSVINDNRGTVEPVRPMDTPSSSSSAPAGLVLEGRALCIVPAVDRGRAKELRSHPFLDAGPQDRRNLHLLGETLLKPKTSAAKRFWPPIDISYREQAVRERRKELKTNHNLFVSRTRLSLRHLPLATDEKIIRKVLYAAVHRARAHPEGPIIDASIFPPTGKPLLKQVKVVRDPERKRSKGYAFAEFAEPGDALAAVRYLANWEPGLWRELGGEVFSTNKTSRHKASAGAFRAKAPLVEFATEKRAILEQRQARLNRDTASATTNFRGKQP